MLKIGIIIADDMEYAPISQMGGEYEEFFGREGHNFSLGTGDDAVTIRTVCCGIGKVNAATAAMHLIDSGCNILLNTGLSGGISGVARGSLAIGTAFSEHDFDLTPLGYKKGVKPSQENTYKADSALVKHFSNIYPSAVCGPMVTGDCFVCDSALRDTLKETYGAISCDMETAAIASVCHITNTPFFSLRRISDDAGEDASTCYRDMNDNEKFDLAVLLLEGAKKLKV